MSYCQIIPFIDGIPQPGIEFSNGWGGAPRIWNSIYNAYLKDPEKSYDSWITRSDLKPFWNLAVREDVPLLDRTIHASTFDYFFIRRADFSRYASDLREFVEKYPVANGHEDHLPAWADWIESSDADAIGFHATSVSANPWVSQDPETGEDISKPLEEGWDLYEWISSPRIAN